MDAPDRGTRLLLAAALAVALLCAFTGQRDRQLWAPDEAREAGITAAMARTGDWVVPRLNGRPFLEKPPLFHAAGAAILDATGSRSPFAFRLAAALFSLATLAATFALGRRIGGARLGAVAVMVLATTGGFHAAAHRAVTDNAIPPFVTLAFLALASLMGGGSPGAAFALGGAACGVAFLAKGAIGPAFFAAGAGTALLLAREQRRLLHPLLVPGLLLAVLPPTAWLLALHGAEGTAAVRTVLVDNNWGRAAGATADHAEGPFYYLVKAPIFLLPWLPLAALGARRAWREGGLRRIPLAWLGAGLLLLTAATAKRPVYLLPLAPAAALLAAIEVEALMARFPRWTGGRVGALFLGSAAAFVVVFGLLGPAGDREKGLDGFAAAVAERSRGRETVLFRPSEEIEGILTLRLDGAIPMASTRAEFAEILRLARGDLLVVGPEADPAFREIRLGSSASWPVEAAGTPMVLAVLPGPAVR